MMDKAIVKNYLGAKKTYDDHMENLQALQKKGADLDAGLPILKKAAEEAEVEKKRVLDSFCIDKASENQVETAQRAFDSATAKLAHSQEMLETIKKKIGTAESGSMKLLDQVRKYQGEVWQQIVPEIEERIIKKVGVDLVFLFAANVRQHGAWLMNHY